MEDDKKESIASPVRMKSEFTILSMYVKDRISSPALLLIKAFCQARQQRSHLWIAEDLCQKLRIYTSRGSRSLVFRLCRCLNALDPLAAVKGSLKQCCVVLAVIVQNVRILIRNHLGLCMTGIALNRFDIAAVQLQFISDTGMAKTVENDLRQIILFNELSKKGFVRITLVAGSTLSTSAFFL